MANICGKLAGGMSVGCGSDIQKRYAQEVVIINKDDIATSTKTFSTGEAGQHNVTFTLKASKTGYKFEFPANGSGVSGTVDKTTSDLGLVQYNHNVNILAIGAGEDMKAILTSLDTGRYVVAMKIGSVIEIYGLDNGVSTGDYTLDLAGGAGATVVTLTSGEGREESFLPLIYKPAGAGDAVADFDSLFATGA